MKSLFLVLFVLVSMILNAQESITRGLIVGTTATGKVTIDNNELKALNNITGNIKTQLDAKVNIADGDISDIDSLVTETYKKYNILQSLGSTCKTVTKYCSLTDKLGVVLSDGVTLLVEMETVPYSYTFSGFRYWPTVTGSYTFDQNNKVGVYKLVGTTFTLMTSTTSTTTSLWTQTGGDAATATFSATYSVPANERIFVAMLINVSATATAMSIIGSSTAGDERFDNIAPNIFFDTTYPLILQRTSTTDLLSSFDISTCIRASGIPLLIAF